MNAAVLLLSLAPGADPDSDARAALAFSLALSASRPAPPVSPACDCAGKGKDACRCPGKSGGEACKCGAQRRRTPCGGCVCGCEDRPDAGHCRCGEKGKAAAPTPKAGLDYSAAFVPGPTGIPVWTPLRTPGQGSYGTLLEAARARPAAPAQTPNCPPGGT